MADFNFSDFSQFPQASPGFPVPDPLQAQAAATGITNPLLPQGQMPMGPNAPVPTPANQPAPRQRTAATPTALTEQQRRLQGGTGMTDTGAGADAGWAPASFTGGQFNLSGDPNNILRQIASFDMSQFNRLNKNAQDSVARSISIMADGLDQQKRINARIDEATQQLQYAQEQEVQRQQSMDQQLTEWAQRTPTRESFYALGMQLAAPLSVLAAIGGAMTKTNAVGLLSATNGIMEGINTGSEEKFQDALQRWRTQYEMLQDHQQRGENIYNTIKDAYAGRIDAAEKASERQRQMTADQLAPEQLKIGTGLKLMESQAKVMKDLENIALAVERARDAALNRMAYGIYAGVASGVTPISDDTPLKDLNPTWGPMQLAGELHSAGISSMTGGRYSSNPEQMMAWIAGHPDMTVGDTKRIFQGGQATLRGLTAATGASGRIAGGIAGTARDLDIVVPQALEAAAQVAQNRTRFVPVNEILQKLDEYSGDPYYWAFYQYNTNVENAYRTVARRSGSSTGPEREAVIRALKTANSFEAYKAVTDIIMKETASARRGYGLAMQPGEYRDLPPAPTYSPPTLLPGGRQPQLPTIHNKQEYDALPSGQNTPFIGPDGQRYTKP